MTMQATREPSVRPAVHHSLPENVGRIERAVSVGSGGWLLLKGLRHGGLVGATTAGLGAMLIKRGVSGHCEVYEKLGMNTNGHGHSHSEPAPEDFYERGIHVVQAYTINKSPNELFAFWRNFENLPKFMSHLQEVKVVDEKKSHWKASAPAGFSVEWEAEIISEEPNHSISWRSIDGAAVDHAGSVRFIETSNRGTEVRVVLDYIPPLGKLGAAVAKIFGEEPGQQIKEDLRHFKQLMESGEIPTAKGPRGRCQPAGKESRRP